MGKQSRRLLGPVSELHRPEGIDLNCAREALFEILYRAIGGLVGTQCEADVAARAGRLTEALDSATRRFDCLPSSLIPHLSST